MPEQVVQRLEPVSFCQVQITDKFWAPRQEVNRRVTIPHQYRMCKETGRIDAFRLTWKPGDPNPPHIFWDSDVGKWLEAAAYTLVTAPDPELRRRVDEVAELVASAQQPDGYLNTHFTVVEPEKRWTNLRDWHELYCAGHLIEGAVAHYEATGSRKLLDALCRYTDHMERVFGTEPGKKRGYCGHPEIELALVKLYRATGEQRYLKLAKYFVDERGRQPHYFDEEARARGEDPAAFWQKSYEYCQAHQPVREQREVVGHAVRAFYLYSGMAEVAALTGDAALLAACRSLWEDVTLRKMYVTGGVGPSKHNEGFTSAYDLPNETAYAETCAAIALVFFAHRMALIEADRRYADVMERALYNGILSGVSLDGSKFFYDNPLASRGTHHRKEWFGCACCPPNVARLLASLGQYVYATAASAAYVHLYVGSRARLTVAGQTVELTQETDYPWSGDGRLTVQPATPARFDLMLRVPGWCARWTLRVNGRTATAPVVRGYARLRRRWAAGDTVEWSFAMPVERITAHPAVAADVGRVALQRGPFVYCLEECDNPRVGAMLLPERSRLNARFDRRLIGGMVVIEGWAERVKAAGWQGRLYRPRREAQREAVRFKAVPYFAWDNRQPGAMVVWLPEV